MRYVSIIAMGLALSGCDTFTSGEELAAQACEAFIAEGLKAPTTYKRVSVANPPHEAGKSFRYVALTYDADNAFGTPIRGGQVCAFKVDPKTGEYPDGGLMKSYAGLAHSQKTLRDVQAMTGNKVDERPTGAFDCCVTKEDDQAALESFGVRASIAAQ